jgi:NhaP-type Na+/H+ or K+/H+ antiporter
LGLLVGGTVGLFLDHFLIDALFGVAIGLVVAYIVRNIKT